MELGGIIDYTAGFAVMAGIYAIMSLGLNVHWGFTGLFNIGIAGFFALGGYTSAILTSPPPQEGQFEEFLFGGNWASYAALDWGIDLWFLLALIAAALVCGLIALVIGYVTLRLHDDYLGIATLGIAESVRLFFLNEKWVANGSRGMYRIPKFLGDWISPGNYDYLYLAVVLAALAVMFLAVHQAIRSPWGRVLRAIREDETTAAASGKNIFAFKLQSFVLGAMIMGVGGALFTHHLRFVAPETFDPLLATFIIWAMLMVGGAGNNAGAVLGALVVWGIWTGTQFLPGALFEDPNFRFLMIGVLIVAVMLARPGGLLSETRRQSRRPPASDGNNAAAAANPDAGAGAGRPPPG